MIVSGKYERKELIQSGVVRTYRARHQALGHELMLHFIYAGEQGAALLELLSQLPESKRKLFLDAGEHESAAYLVSWPLPEFDNLIGWLGRAIRGPSKAPAPPQPAPAKTVTDAGEFTRMFRAAMPGPPVKPARPAEVPVELETPAEQAGQPGEFTAFFRDAALPAGPSGGPPPPVVRREPKAAEPKEGEFTALFGSAPGPPLEPAAPPPQPAHAPEPASGGLTEFFRVPVGGGPLPAEPATASREPAAVGAPAPLSYQAPAPQPPAAPVQYRPQQPGAAARPPAGVSPKVVWGLLGLLFLLALAVVVLFVFRR